MKLASARGTVRETVPHCSLEGLKAPPSNLYYPFSSLQMHSKSLHKRVTDQNTNTNWFDWPAPKYSLRDYSLRRCGSSTFLRREAIVLCIGADADMVQTRGCGRERACEIPDTYIPHASSRPHLLLYTLS